MPRLWSLLAMGVLLVASPSHGATDVIVPSAPSERGSEEDYQRSLHSLKDANKAMKRKRWKRMLTHAESAWRIYKSPVYALMRGIAHGRLGNHKEAMLWLITTKAMNPPSELKSKLGEALTKSGQAAQIGLVKLSVAPKQGSISVEGVKVPGDFVGLSYGPHVFTATADGYKSLDRKVTVGANPIQVGFELTELPKVEKKPIKVEQPPPVPAEEPSIAVPLALIIGGVVAAGAGVGLHVWGLGAASDINDQNGTWNAQGLTPEEAEMRVDDLHATAATGSTVAYVMYGLGVGLITAGAVIWAMQGSDDGEGQADVVLTPAVAPSGGGVVLGGRF
jgi:hypothetical protein